MKEEWKGPEGLSLLFFPVLLYSGKEMVARKSFFTCNSKGKNY